jgi:hypothetical protein
VQFPRILVEGDCLAKSSTTQADTYVSLVSLFINSRSSPDVNSYAKE